MERNFFLREKMELRKSFPISKPDKRQHVQHVRRQTCHFSSFLLLNKTLRHNIGETQNVFGSTKKNREKWIS